MYVKWLLTEIIVSTYLALYITHTDNITKKWNYINVLKSACQTYRTLGPTIGILDYDTYNLWIVNGKRHIQLNIFGFCIPVFSHNWLVWYTKGLPWSITVNYQDTNFEFFIFLSRKGTGRSIKILLSSSLFPWMLLVTPSWAIINLYDEFVSFFIFSEFWSWALARSRKSQSYFRDSHTGKTILIRTATFWLITLMSVSAPAASSFLVMGMWFLHTAMCRAVDPNALFFFSAPNAASTSAAVPLRTAAHRSLMGRDIRALRPLLPLAMGVAAAQPMGDASFAKNREKKSSFFLLLPEYRQIQASIWQKRQTACCGFLSVSRIRICD